MPVVNSVIVRDILTNDSVPLPLTHEVFILRRENVQLRVKSHKFGNLSGSGTLFVSNMRIAFICTSNRKPDTFISYYMNLHEIRDESFEQPIFGANYLRGHAVPEFPGEYADEWRVVFRSGGCGTLLPVLGDMLVRARGSHQASSPFINQVIVPAQVVGYVDPSDPSVIYVQQPQARMQGAE